MRLTIPERISLLGILPREGNIITLRIIRKLQERLSFTETEMTRWKMVNTSHPDGRVSITWDEDFAKEEVDIEIGENATAIIKRELRIVEGQGKLRYDAISIYEKFLEETEKEEDA